MTTEVTPPRISVSARNNALAAEAAAKPAIEWPTPIVNSVTDALEDVACSVERLVALHQSNHADLGDYVEDLPEGPLKNRIYDCWMIFTTVGEQIKRTHLLVGAITEKAYEDRRAA